MVVDRHREALLRSVLADDVLVQECLDLGGLRELEASFSFLEIALLVDDIGADLDALIADVDVRSGDELADLALALAAKRAA